MSTRLPHFDRPPTQPSLALIAGPTASGKSDCALRLALALQAGGRKAVIINADSAQLYADLPVLSAAPSPQDQASVPHALYGAWDGSTPASAADWAKRAAACVADAHAQGAVPVLVGGTGLYIRTLLDGIAPVPDIDPAVREAVRALPVAQAYAALQHEDVERAAALNPADTTRVARALEVVRSTGQPLAHWQARKVGGIGAGVSLHPLVLLPDRAWLAQRCAARFGQMVAQGALDEVARLLARGLDPALPVMRAIGVAEIAGYLRGEWSLNEAMARGILATRQYAKRQFTWFSRQPPAHWPRANAGWLPEDFQPERDFASLFRESRVDT